MIQDILRRFDEYHWACDDRQAMIDLYDTLIQEETKELHSAILSWDTIWIVDGICDLARVTVWYWYYSWEDSHMFFYIWQQMLWADIFDKCMTEIIRSNFTKSKSSQDNWKIIKWADYSPPNLRDIIYIKESGEIQSPSALDIGE